MPELPEVAAFQSYFDEAALEQPIVQTRIHDDKIFRNVDALPFIQATAGERFIGSKRIGKYLFAELSNGQWVQFHFGMTGDFILYTDGLEKPRHERFHFEFADGAKLGFDCPRKFARICLFESFAECLESSGLGPDALTISFPQFYEQAQGRKTTIKGFLLNQKILAGVGNLYADEVLWQARIHPKSVTGKLSKSQLKKIWKLTQNILSDAVERRPYYKQYPNDWYWQWRKEGEKGPTGRGLVVSDKVAGRTTYWVEGVQKLFA